MCFRPASASATNTCPMCGHENPAGVTKCQECGFEAASWHAAPGAPGAPKAPGAPAAPGAPKAPGAPMAPKVPGAPKAPGM